MRATSCVRGSPGFIDVSADRSDNRIIAAFDSSRPAYVRGGERIASGDCERLSRKAVRCPVEDQASFD